MTPRHLLQCQQVDKFIMTVFVDIGKMRMYHATQMWHLRRYERVRRVDRTTSAFLIKISLLLIIYLQANTLLLEFVLTWMTTND